MEFSDSSYQDDLLLNHNNEQQVIINSQQNYDNDLIFELDNEFMSSIKQQQQKQPRDYTTNQSFNDDFANAPQQNYRLWLSSV